eukprot:7627921-Pyramimonas_sp.AAC.1
MAYRRGQGSKHNSLGTVGPPSPWEVGALDELEKPVALDLAADLLPVLVKTDEELLHLGLGIASLELTPTSTVGQLEGLMRVDD